MCGFEKLKEQLPRKERFDSSLTSRKISGKGYEHVLKVWDSLKKKMLKDYSDLHLKSDVLLLAGVFEKFRNGSLKIYGLCPSHYLSAAAESWESLINNTKIELELILDADMYLLVEKGLRCGISHIAKRYSKASNKYLKSYDTKQESKHIIYLDANK